MEPAYSKLPKQEPWRVDIEKSPGWSGITAGSSQKHIPIITNDYICSYSTNEPGDEIDWHTHMPSLYQVQIITQGKKRFHYIDNDGEEQSMEAHAGEAVYLPGGMHNRVEYFGDEPQQGITLMPNIPFKRVEHMFGEHLDKYDPRDIPAGLQYDNVNDRVIKKTDSAIIE